MTIKINYVMKKEVINKDNISKFFINQKDRRDIRQGKVKEIIKTLKDNKHFSAPFVVNDINNRWRLIDGNHRYESIDQMIKIDKKFEIVIWIAMYRDLTLEQEREIYHEWNIGTPQTSTDFLKAYFDTIPLGKEMLKRLPVSIYGDKKTMNIKNLVGNQIIAKEHKKFNVYSAGREETIDDFRNITLDDIDTLEEFVIFMKNTFGEYYRGSQFYQTTPLSAFYRIWFDNQNIDQEKIIRAFKKVFLSNPESWEKFTKVGSRIMCQLFYNTAVTNINAVSKVHFKTDLESIDEFEKERTILKKVIIKQ